MLHAVDSVRPYSLPSYSQLYERAVYVMNRGRGKTLNNTTTIAIAGSMFIQLLRRELWLDVRVVVVQLSRNISEEYSKNRSREKEE